MRLPWHNKVIRDESRGAAQFYESGVLKTTINLYSVTRGGRVFEVPLSIDEVEDAILLAVKTKQEKK